MFELAYHCGVSPLDVDRLSVVDFINLKLGIDQVRKQIAKSNETR